MWGILAIQGLAFNIDALLCNSPFEADPGDDAITIVFDLLKRCGKHLTITPQILNKLISNKRTKDTFVNQSDAHCSKISACSMHVDMAQ